MSANISGSDNGLAKLFSDNARVKILAQFIENPEKEYRVSQLVEDAGLSRGSWYTNKDELLESDVIEEVNGRYRLNQGHPLTPLLKSIYRYPGSRKRED